MAGSMIEGQGSAGPTGQSPAPAGRGSKTVAVVGAGPAGLFAAERLALAGCHVQVIERMPSVARKLLLAGRGGLNLTHSEPLATLVQRYGAAAPVLASMIERFGPRHLMAWCEGLGEPAFVGSSGRVFPRSLKSSPLTRAWLRRLSGLGVDLTVRTRWLGWDDEGRLVLEGPAGRRSLSADAVVLALGGASWPRLGSDGSWTVLLSARGVAIRPLQPANMGVEIAWSPFLRERFAGTPLKRIAIAVAGATARGDAVLTAYGLEGGAVYAVSGLIRDALARGGSVELQLDLRPDLTQDRLAALLARPRGGQSMSNFLRKAAKLSPPGVALLRESRLPMDSLPFDPARLAALIKAAPLRVTGVRGLERAISSAGGIALAALDDHLMLKAIPGTFAAGEMIDWEAPTGGYLLQACFSTAHASAEGVVAWLAERRERP
jgi:uncharacterized flavoprotein (TIGR03862 family)